MFPDECRLCDAPLREFSRLPVCSACLKEIEPLAAEYSCSCCHTPFLNSYPLDEMGRCPLCRLGLSNFDAAFSYGVYDGKLRDLIHLFKYGKVRSLARPFGRLLIAAMPLGMRFDAIVPMPMHWLRKWKRGFNQAELLARAVARHSGIPLVNALRRTRRAPAQAGLSASQRRRNAAGSFGIRRPEAVRGRHILLVDDVLTTGATARAAASVLKRAGAARVTVLTLARADRRHFIGGLSGGSSYTVALGAR